MPELVSHVPEADRVRANTWPDVNERIDRRTRLRLRQAGSSSVALDRRLRRIDLEWDVERVLEAEVALTGLAGLALGALVNRRLLAIPALAATMLLLHATHGWYPLLALLRRAGLRTEDEIDRERYALKAMAVHFDELPQQTSSGAARAAAAWRAVCR